MAARLLACSSPLRIPQTPSRAQTHSSVRLADKDFWRVSSSPGGLATPQRRRIGPVASGKCLGRAAMKRGSAHIGKRQMKGPAFGRAFHCCKPKGCRTAGRGPQGTILVSWGGGAYSAAISSASPSCRISSSSRSAASISAVTSSRTRAAASSSSGESWTLR